MSSAQRERERERERETETETETERQRERQRERQPECNIYHYTGIDCDVKSNSVRQIEMESLTGRSSSIHFSTFVRRMYER